MKKSFTIIEIIIVIVIVMIISTMGLAYYNTYSQQLTLKSEVLDLVKELELIKKKALSSDKTNGCSDQFYGYQININSNNYQWGILCPNFQLIKTKTLPNSIIFLNNQQITFNPLKTNFSTQISITIKNLQINKCLNINISTNGIINFDETFQNCP